MEIPRLSSEQMALVDELALEHGLDIVQMMEYAGLNIARYAQKWESKHILILAGKGHNGGDALAAGRHLSNWGYKISILLAEVPEKLREASRRHFDLLRQMSIYMEEWNGSKEQKDLFLSADLIIDGLIGYNIKGDPRAPHDEIIKLANEVEAPVLAIDLPSGLDGSSGKAYSPCIEASNTLTLDLPKVGLFMGDAGDYVGELAVCDLGIPYFIHEKAGVEVPADLFKKESIVLL